MTDRPTDRLFHIFFGTVRPGVVAGGTRVLHERQRLSCIDGDGDGDAASSSPSSLSLSYPPPPPSEASSSRQRCRARCVRPVEHARRALRAAIRIARPIGAVQRPRGGIVRRHGIAAEDTGGIEIRVGIARRVGLGVGVDTVLRRVRRE